MSLTPHCLRNINGVMALDIFVSDLVAASREVKENTSSLASLFPESSLVATLLRGGNEENWGFASLHAPGLTRDILSVAFRRLYSAIMDCGVACTAKHPDPLRAVLTRSAAATAVATAAALSMGGRAPRSRI
jgi:hypothetical protein